MIMKKKYFLLFVVLLISFNGFSQAAPTINVTIPTPLPACNPGDCTDLFAVFPMVKQTTGYTVAPITYAPSFPFTTGTEIPATADDIWKSFSLPFPFCFYGVNYNKVLVGSNGILSFDFVNNVPDVNGECAWEYSNPIPNPGFPERNAIYGVFQDTDISPAATGDDAINDNIQKVNYYLLDTGPNAAPNRVFVANWNQLPQFSCHASSGVQTSQIVIYETTNIIDVYVSNRTPCNSWNDGSGLIGVQNQAGTLATVPPGRNTGRWSAANEAWRFTPNGIDSNVSVSWNVAGVPLGSVDENPINVCPTGPTTYTAVTSYTRCDGSVVSAKKDIVVDIAPRLPVLSPQDITICTAAGPPYTVNIDQNAYILSGVSSPSDYAIKYYENPTAAANDAPTNINYNSDADLANFTFNTAAPKTIYVRLEDFVTTGCANVRSFNINVGAPSGTISYTSSPYCNNLPAAQTVTNNALTSGGTYSATPSGLNIDPVTGSINSGSNPGNYVVKYEIAASGSCPLFSTTTNVVIQSCACTVVASSVSETLCANTSLNPMTFTVAGGAVSASINSGTLPNGVTGNFASGVFTVSGMPTIPGIYTIEVLVDSGADTCTVQATITVEDNTSLTLTSAAATTNQTVCINELITPITYAIADGGTGATVTGLPSGVTAVYNSGLLTISGTPDNTTGSGIFNYFVTTSGGCFSASLSGTISVNPDATITLTSAAATTNQAICINTAINNITYQIADGGTGANVTGLPGGISGAYASGIFTISGTANAAGTFNYVVSTSGGCGSASLNGTITVNSNATIVLNSASYTESQIVCVNTAIDPIGYTIAGGATGALVSGLPSGVTGNYSAGLFTISGSPVGTGTFNYIVTTTGGCATATHGGSITVNPDATIALTSAAATTNQILCINTAINSITYSIGNATGATVTGLPTGVNGNYVSGVFTISGTPSESGTFNYTVNTSGGCASGSLNGTITVNPAVSLVLTSAASTASQSVCINTAIAPIVYQIADGGTNASVTGLPSGVSGSYSGGVFTISGITNASGTFNYTVTTSGGCSVATLSGTITVNPDVTMTLTSAAATTNQTLCINTPIDPITYALANTDAIGANVSGLPSGINVSFASGVLTLSGAPGASGTFNYSVTTSGGCSSVTLNGSITVNPDDSIVLTSPANTTSQTVCINTAIAPIDYLVADGGTGATVTGLPAGVTGIYNAGVFSISGTPNTAGVFNYVVTTSGSCASASLGGTITVNPNVTMVLNSVASTTNQTVCIDTGINAIEYNLANTDAVGATVTGLPSGVSGSYVAGLYTIRGIPNVAGTFNYTITTSGGCSSVSLNGTITVNPNATLVLTSATGIPGATICINTLINPITYAVADGGTGATVTGLPNGVSGSYSGGVFTISGTPTQSGTFDYVVSTTGGCGTASLGGRIIVTPNVTMALTSLAATTNQTVCVDKPIDAITYSISNAGTNGATITGLPNGVTGRYAGGIYTISGSPSQTGTFNYTITTSGGCDAVALNGSIAVTPNATIVLTSLPATADQTVCINTAVDPVVYTIGNGATGASITSGGLPNGVTGVFSGSTFTINGTATQAGTYNYVVSIVGGCGTATLNGSIVVKQLVNIVLTSAAVTAFQTVCPNESIDPITYSIGNDGTGATVTGLPTGISGNFASGIFTISGSTASVGTFNFTVTTSGGCGSASLTGSIEINPAATITLNSAPGTDAQSICINEPIVNITYQVATGATGASVTSGTLPAGIQGSFSGGIFTLTGTPTESGTFSYTVTTSGGCLTASLSGTITVNPLPVIVLPQSGFICIDESGNPKPGSTYTLTTNLSILTYSFVWSDSNGIITGQNGNSYEAPEPGLYSVEVTNTTTGCIASASATIVPSLPPVAIFAAASSYFSEEQVVTVTVTPPGNYEYQLDNGVFQESNQFINLTSGTHEVVVRDKFGCGTIKATVRIIDYPKFFTPNGDGYNDTWNIPDISDQPASRIYIFDRYGKLLKEISPKGTGWDGTYNAQLLPSSDYWFKVFFEESGIQKEFKSHFSLKR